jgi:hypothetical protein
MLDDVLVAFGSSVVHHSAFGPTVFQRPGSATMAKREKRLEVPDLRCLEQSELKLEGNQFPTA